MLQLLYVAVPLSSILEQQSLAGISINRFVTFTFLYDDYITQTVNMCKVRKMQLNCKIFIKLNLD